MKIDENKGVIALVLLGGIAIGAWSATVTTAMLFLSMLVVTYSSLKHEPWLETFFEP